MKDRLAYSPKEAKIPERVEINFKKSPIKYAMYNIPPQTQYQPFDDSRPIASTSSEFQNIRKVPEETAALRQTMNNKMFARLQKSNTLVLQDEGKNKLTDFLRQTMGSSKSNRIYSETLIPDNAYSGEAYDRPLWTDDGNRNNNKYIEPYRPLHRKVVSTLNDNSSLREYEKLSEKIDRNRQLINELKTTKKEGKDLLKNVNHHRSPTYLHIDYQQKDKEEPLQFAKKATKKEDPANFYTPKIEKSSKPDTKFNSSPLIEKAKSSEKKADEPTISSFSTISSAKKKNSVLSSDKSINIEDFIVGRKLGQGKFGCVNLARHKRTNGIFAIKKVPKSLIKANMMVDQLALQIRIQSCLKHANILEMFGCFDDKSHLYIILEYMNGGTLYQRSKKQRISQKDTSSIIRQITEAIDYLHDLGIAHRDVKPENVVISNNVYKLCDFGWAAICNQRRKTYCGTFDYVAPEILEGVQYDMTVDLWCLGVLTFELLTGKAPFYHISRKQTMKRILNVENENIVFPQGMSDMAKDFIDKLIRKDPSKRIRTGEALLHPFLKVQQDDG